MRSLFLTFLIVVMTTCEAAGAHLSRISRSSTAASIQVFAYFDRAPLFRERISERRLDLIFLNTSIAEILPTPEPDEVIVKTLVLQDENDAVVSLFFRYIPQDLSITSDPSGVVIIDLIAGNRFTETYRDLSTELGFLSPVSRLRETFVNPLTFLAYRDDWRSFFRQFEGNSEVEPAPQPFIPAFPFTSLLTSDGISEHQASLAAIEELSGLDRFEALRQIQKRLKNVDNDEEQKYFALAHADILFRLGSVDAALAQFNILAETYGHESAGSLALYAAGLIEAQKENYHLAQAKLSPLLDRLPRLDPLRAYVRFALSETLLATGNLERMNQLFEEENFSAGIEQPLSLRKADLAFASGRFEEAFTIYDDLYGTEVMRGHPYSINGYCTLLLKRRDNDRAQQCYLDLAARLGNQADAAQALYLAALTGQGTRPLEETEQFFNQIIDRYPQTSAALRAEIKRADNCIVYGVECPEQVSDSYRSIADRASDRAIAAEAAFKEALVYLLEGDHLTAIKSAQQMLRTFQSGILRDHAMALIIQLLPNEIQHLVEGQRDIEAIALAQQNRTLFEKGWLDDDLLFSLSLAFERLRMYPEALQLLLYLKNTSATPVPEQVLFATLRSAHALGAHYLVEDLATEYSYRFPEGRHELDVLFYRLSCKYGVGKIDEALSLLPDPIPQRSDYRILAATLDFHQNNFRRTANLLLPLYRAEENVLSADHLYMLAESLFELGESAESRELFRRLAENGRYRSAALHRLTLLSSTLEDFVSGAQADAKMSEPAATDPWLRFATQDLRYKELMSNL